MKTFCYRIFYASTVLFFFTLCSISSDAILCEPLFEEDWNGFIAAIQFSPGGIAVLCPFTIQGDGCPNDNNDFGIYEIQTGKQLYILCYSFYAGYEQTCVIDCPGTKFVVQPGSRLELDRFTFQGSSNGAPVQVKSKGELAIYNSILRNNDNVNSNGGAINAEHSSIVTLFNCHFESNTANSGGALYTLGFINIEDSTFTDNRALSPSRDEGGGAIYLGQDAAADIANSVFRGNEAIFLGPVILDRSDHNGNTIHNKENSACHNKVITTGVECNGEHIAWNNQPAPRGMGNLSPRGDVGIIGASCLQFDNACTSSNKNNPSAGTRSSPHYEESGPPINIPLCSAHPKCYGLNGNCCPTLDGTQLFCCE